MQCGWPRVGVVVMGVVLSSAFVLSGSVCAQVPLTGKIVFESAEFGGDDLAEPADIWVMGADGSNQRNLTKHPSRDKGPSWSPDGRKIAFWSQRRDGTGIYIMDANGEFPRRLMDFPGSRAAWSPDGQQIAFSAYVNNNFDIYVVDVHERGPGGRLPMPERLTRDRARDTWPSWSPDGRQIAFESDREEDKAKAGI